MATPPNRTELVDDYPNPSTGVFKAGIGKFYDYVKGLLGATGNAAEARTALGVPSSVDAALTGNPTATTQASTDNSTRIATTAWARVGFAISLGSVGYIKFPDWLGGLIVQWGTTVGTADGGGGVAFSFPLTYPNSVFTTVGFIGDNGDNKTALFGTLGTTTSVARWVFIDSTTGAARPSLIARINWVSFGR